MDSRSLSFASEIIRATNGRGVDLVLNSLTGDAREKSLEVLARYGRFLELGKPNVVLAVLAGIAQFFQARMMITRQQPKKVPGAKDEEMLAIVNKQMMYMMPALTVFIGWSALTATSRPVRRSRA